MKRRFPKFLRFAQDGPNGRPASEIRRRWISQERRRTHRRERREGKADVARQLENS
jgi:hypothetical protein